MRRLFGHTDFRHDLITPQEVAAAGGVEAGCTVRFVMSGETLVGKVNRVTKRATVLVKCSKNHPEAREFSDGKSSVGFYPSSLSRWRAAPLCPTEAPNICLLGL